jgi:CheY-like chemotaxis protein
MESLRGDAMVLLLDDNELQLATRKAILRQAGHHVLTALNAAEALKVVRHPEKSLALKLIITDHLMPGMCGDEFVREVRTTLPDVPILVITGHPEAGGDYTGLNVELLPKPCGPELLLERAAPALPHPLSRTA